ncbi:T9SS type A sorting domain-containing protein [Lacibacter sp. H407]|uniref:T9SS type A sorting domain-containing protein n=1 Tax=Lacibacter sp. H407 TaxID=3133423 RepID=UPI0030BD932B
MKAILSYSIAIVLSTVLFINTSFAQITATEADPAVITITQQSPTDPSPIGTNIAGNTVFKFRVANNSAVPGATGTIPAGALTYTVQFNPFYTFNSLVSTTEFAVTFMDAETYVIQLTNSVPMAAGDVLDFYLNVKPTSNTTTPAGETVTLNVDRTVPITTANSSTGNDNVAKQFTVAAGSSLPVRSVHLGSTSNASSVNLKWVTESEYNTDHFEIERSVDGRSFMALGTTKAAGNTTSTTTYTSADDIRAIATKPVVFYRIRVVDVDGKYSYSNTIAIRLVKQSKVQVWPSPFSSQLNLQVEQEAGAVLEVRMFNMSGVIVYNKRQITTAGTNNIQLVDQLSRLSGGLYVIELMSNNSKIYSETIVKQ